MAKAKQFTRPPKKLKSKGAALETEDDYQEAADREEEAGGKHRVGDPAKSGRAFTRALEIYDKGLQRYPTSFDLAYNKARLELEITQYPALVEHIGLSLIDLLGKTLDSHRYALRLNEENPDTLFNTSQVLTRLAEELSEAGRSHDAVPLLQESLELLSGCLSRQEMLLEQQQADFQDAEEGGVPLDADEQPVYTNGVDASEQTATVEVPITANDLLDTVHASMSSLTTLIPIVEQSALATYGDMAHILTEKKAITYVSLLPEDLRSAARFSMTVDRAIFIAALANAQCSFMATELETYLARLEDAFNIAGKEHSAHALCAEAEARTEFTLTTVDRLTDPADALLPLCWKQLTTVHELYSAALKLEDDDAKERRANIYYTRAEVELLRHRLASMPGTSLTDGIKRSVETLVKNASTFFKGAAQLARSAGDTELEVKAKQRWMIATDIAAILYGVETTESPFEGNAANVRGDLVQALESVVDEGWIEMSLGAQIMARMRG